MSPDDDVCNDYDTRRIGRRLRKQCADDELDAADVQQRADEAVGAHGHTGDPLRGRPGAVRGAAPPARRAVEERPRARQLDQHVELL